MRAPLKLATTVLRTILENQQKGLALVAVAPSGYEVRTYSGERLIAVASFRSLKVARGAFNRAVESGAGVHRPEPLSPLYQRRRWQ